MNAIAVLFGGNLQPYAFQKLFSGECAFTQTLRRAAALADVSRLVLFVHDDFDTGCLPKDLADVELVRQPAWNTNNLLENLAAVSAGFDLVYYAWADTPLLDAELALAIQRRFTRYAAEYGYADGWPAGLAPELLLPATAVFLSKLNGGAELPVTRDTLFTVLQKDINSFDIETEVSPVDLRPLRLNLAADTKRNLLLLSRFAAENWSGYTGIEKIIAEKPALLRTLPAFFPVMVSDMCPQRCSLCPFSQEPWSGHYMQPEKFSLLLDKIAAFAGEAVIDLSLWGEIALHPQKLLLIEAVLKNPALSLVIETCGIGWKQEEITAIAQMPGSGQVRETGLAALSWIVSLDSANEERYRQLHGDGFNEAVNLVKILLPLFPNNVYVQALRCKGEEDDIEAFYRFWHTTGAQVIIQKHDNFCGTLPLLRAGDISPVVRMPCWHIMRDMPVYLDGTVFPCREGGALRGAPPAAGGSGEAEGFAARGAPPPLGNVFEDSLERIWQRGEVLYSEHCKKNYNQFCVNCDEYYTFNF